jgi:aspartyl-tRNA(Asn)/glutamyl-tRNA(Gln) amidotransferase subunit A
MSASELIAKFADKSLSPVEATRAALDRIARHNDKINAFCYVAGDQAEAAAQASEARWTAGAPLGPLDGVPTSIKDLTSVKGWRTGKGSLTSEGDGPATEDSAVVARLKESGAVLLGKTTTPEFGWKGVTDSLLTGVTRNPWNLAKTPGGSSGGAAAALAAGMGQLAQGSDGGGSIRIPCGFTGLPGLKASAGRVPVYPASPFHTLSHAGPMARSVRDLALMLTVISRPDNRDWYALPYLDRDWRDGLDDGVDGLRIAFSADLGYADVDDEIAGIVAEGARVFADLGARLENQDPGFDDPTAMFRLLWWAGSADIVGAMTPESRAKLEPGFRQLAEEGEKISLADFTAAANARVALGQFMNHFHEHYDLLVTPTMATPAFDVGALAPDGDDDSIRWLRWTPFTYPFNMTGQPAATVPCGFTKAGLPVGLQIVGPRHRDDLVLRAARAFEAARPQPTRAPLDDL